MSARRLSTIAYTAIPTTAAKVPSNVFFLWKRCVLPTKHPTNAASVSPTPTVIIPECEKNGNTKGCYQTDVRGDDVTLISAVQKWSCYAKEDNSSSPVENYQPVQHYKSHNYIGKGQANEESITICHKRDDHTHQKHMPGFAPARYHVLLRLPF
eukprot:scaffold1844_cov403-Pavlova_lutheri.AAC.3